MPGRITPESDLAERFRGGGLWSKRQEFEPASPEEFFLNGGMCRIEWTAGQRARDVAIQAERRISIERLDIGFSRPSRTQPIALCSWPRSVACAAASGSSSALRRNANGRASVCGAGVQPGKPPHDFHNSASLDFA